MARSRRDDSTSVRATLWLNPNLLVFFAAKNLLLAICSPMITSFSPCLCKIYSMNNPRMDLSSQPVVLAVFCFESIVHALIYIIDKMAIHARTSRSCDPRFHHRPLVPHGHFPHMTRQFVSRLVSRLSITTGPVGQDWSGADPSQRDQQVETGQAPNGHRQVCHLAKIS